ncbi:PREDICTED: zinc finger BED domain-containing protein RICESLEEPER 2-like [Camelina sativa]|uniref:Zinc finger BED domain-containing protein RICESLEEPER 2-like n=1 Tax=Camelina sativa TaxID=90675 RepID=A0ABM1RL25_CAMSA|nr:PREDICTED: zinc finger BED domain-containing protein RICESLEEPER 2-like [Camelina sativa]
MEKSKLKTVLSRVPGRIGLTTSLWRALTIEGYICLTAHYVDVDWVLKTKIICFSAFPPPHTGVAITMKISELLKDWGIEKKVFTIIIDNASANDSMQGALDKIRDSVKYVRGSQTRENLFQNCMETVGIQAEAGLISDVATRWNSTHLMLSRAIQFKGALCNLAEVDKSLPSDFEWERAELICELLQPFAELTKMISSSSYPIANLYFMQVWAIKCWLRDHDDSSDPVICDMVENMNEKYWEEFSVTS